jgi:hypothetical protein
VFYKPWYRQSEFDDERYRPMFTPVADNGQIVRFKLKLDPWNGDGNLRVVPYVRRAMTGTIEEIGSWQVPSKDDWQQYEFAIPDTSAEAVDEIGISIEYFGRLKFLGQLHLADFTVSGPGKVTIEPKLEKLEWGGVTRFTWNRGYFTMEDGRLHVHTATHADLWTGNSYLRDQRVTGWITPLAGSSHLVSARVQGTSRFYAAGFDGGQVVILKEDHGTSVLAKAPFAPELGREYTLELRVIGDKLTLSVDGKELLTATDGDYRYGMGGLRIASAGRMSVGRLEIEDFA